jgi:gliding motility-associated-like protein
VPNIFTPNKDGINDLFFINTKYVNTLNVLIYNRWGQKICELTNTSQTWDGRTTKGEQCSEGTYYYVLEAKDVLGKEYKQRGFITLIR